MSELVEKVARAIDGTLDEKRWFDTDNAARAAIAVILREMAEPSEGMLSLFDEAGIGEIWKDMLAQFAREQGIPDIGEKQ